MRIADRIRSWLPRAKAAEPMPVPVNPRAGWTSLMVHEPFAGAWQRNMPLKMGTVALYSTIYACMARISGDVSKLPFRFKRVDSNGLWQVERNAAYSALLRKPNHYQTAGQFRSDWIQSKLQAGNTYVLKEYDERGVVSKLYVLDPTQVQVLVGEAGTVFYRITYNGNSLSGHSGEQITVPARHIIHDREMALFHPLIGVAPLEAARLAATKNVRIQENASDFFANGAQPGGILTAPAGMSETDAEALKKYWDDNFTGTNRGKVGVIGADMKFTPFAFKSIDSQLVEQLRYSDEQICHAFGIPPFKIGIGSIPAGMKVDDLNLMYLTDALQARIESMEDCLDQGLNLGDDVGIELDLEPLLRMDAKSQAEVEGTLVKNGIKAPNEARRRFNLPPLTGGDSVYLQQQNYSLEALAKRDQSEDPFGKATAAPRSAPTEPKKAGKWIARYSHERGTWELQTPHGVIRNLTRAPDFHRGGTDDVAEAA